MKTRNILFAGACGLLFAFAGCSNPSNTVLVCDPDHQITLGQGHGPELPYEILPGSGIKLDVSKIQFTIGGAIVKPDTVYIFNGAEKLYHLAQPISGDFVVLDASTLNALTGPPFEGFQSGHHLLLHVGRENAANPGYERMTAEWVALIVVK